MQVTINDSANDKLIKITIPFLLAPLAPIFLGAVADVITVQVREDTPADSVIANIRVMDPNNGKLCLLSLAFCDVGEYHAYTYACVGVELNGLRTIPYIGNLLGTKFSKILHYETFYR